MPAMYTDNRWTFTVTATSQHGNFPASNLNIIDSHPLLYSWRSNNQTTQQDLILDVGVNHVITNPVLLNCNFTNVQVSHSPDGNTYTNFATTPAESLFAVARNPYGFYCNRIILATAAAQFVRIRIPAQATTDGMPWFELGMIWLANNWYTFPYGPQVGLRETPKRPVLRAGNAVLTAGPWFSEEEWRMTFKKAEPTLYSQFVLNGVATPQVVYKNLGNFAEVGIFRFRDAATFERNGASVVVNPALEELA